MYCSFHSGSGLSELSSCRERHPTPSVLFLVTSKQIHTIPACFALSSSLTLCEYLILFHRFLMMSLSLNITIGQVTLLITALLLVYLPVSAYLNYRKCPQIKGPWLASVSGLWLFVATAGGDLNLHVAALFEKYGNCAFKLTTQCLRQKAHQSGSLPIKSSPMILSY